MSVQKSEMESNQLGKRLDSSCAEDLVEFVKLKSKETERERFSVSDLAKLKGLYRCIPKFSPYYKKLELIRQYVLLFWQSSKLKDAGLVALLDNLAQDLIVKNWASVDFGNMKQLRSGIALAMDDHLKRESTRICDEFINDPDNPTSEVSSLNDFSFNKLFEDHAAKRIGDKTLVQNIEAQARQNLLRIFKNKSNTDEILQLQEEVTNGWIRMMKHSPAYVGNVPSLARYCWGLSMKKAGQYGVLPMDPLIRASLTEIIEEWRNDILPEDREYSKELKKNLERFLIEFMYQQMNKKSKIYSDIYVLAIRSTFLQRSLELKKYLERIKTALNDHVFSKLLEQLKCEGSFVSKSLKERAANMVKDYKGARVKYNATDKNQYDEEMKRLFEAQLLRLAFENVPEELSDWTKNASETSLGRHPNAHFSISPKVRKINRTDDVGSELLQETLGVTGI